MGHILGHVENLPVLGSSCIWVSPMPLRFLSILLYKTEKSGLDPVLTFPSYCLIARFFPVLNVPHYKKALFNVTTDSIIWTKAFWWLSIKYFIQFQNYWLFLYEQSFLHLAMGYFKYQGAKLNLWACHIQNYTMVYSASLHKTWKHSFMPCPIPLVVVQGRACALQHCQGKSYCSWHCFWHMNKHSLDKQELREKTVFSKKE